MSITTTSYTNHHRHHFALRAFVSKTPRLLFSVHCSDSKPKRGFGSQPTKKDAKTNKVTTSREEKGGVLQQRKSTTDQSGAVPAQAPGLSSPYNGKSKNIVLDVQFEERLEAVRRSALEQRKADEKKEYGPIDYDAPVESEKNTIGLGTKIGVGVAVIVFGLVFALGDFLPSGSINPSEEAAIVNNKLSDKEKATLQLWCCGELRKVLLTSSVPGLWRARLQEYEAMLRVSPKDPTALEGAAVTLAELGEYTRAASLLEDLTKEKPSDSDAFRLLGEVKYGLRDYEGSVAAYRSSTMVSKTIDFEVLRGLTNALLAAKKPDEAVQVLLASRDSLNAEKSIDRDNKADINTMETELQKVDPIQVELLLGKAYSDWGHISDAVSVYDGLISSHPDDFRGYLAKGIILKENGKVGDAERMFIQARFFAPEKAKALVDRYAKQ